MTNRTDKHLIYVLNAWHAADKLDRAVANLYRNARPGSKKTANVLRDDLFEVVRVASFIVTEARKQPPISLWQRIRMKFVRKRKLP